MPRFGDIPQDEEVPRMSDLEAITGGGGEPPTGTGFRHVTGGSEDAAAKLVENADVAANAAIAESKLALGFATHSNANDPAAGEKAALSGTSGTPGAGNRYVTNADPRNSDARTPTSHGAALHDATVEARASKGVANGYAGLDAAAKVPTAQLGGSGASATTYLRGDQTWATPSGGGGGTLREDLVAMWDQSITKTNIPATFADIYTQANSDGKSVQIDTNGKTQVKLQVLWNKVGTGTQTVQVMEVGTANVLISMNVVSGRNVSALTDIPAFAANSQKFYKLQARSTNAADDPVFEGGRLYLK